DVSTNAMYRMGAAPVMDCSQEPTIFQGLRQLNIPRTRIETVAVCAQLRIALEVKAHAANEVQRADGCLDASPGLEIQLKSADVKFALYQQPETTGEAVLGATEHLAAEAAILVATA